MKDINISKTIAAKRHEKGITQDELASFMGVSKASVSKWETGQSYPDIVLLPRLASFFNISVDTLMGYTPQMSGDEIKTLYHRLAEDFSQKPFEEVFGECDLLIRKYYACFPLLSQIVILLVNHCKLVKPERQQEILSLCIDLCRRIKEESGDTSLHVQANSIEALCSLMLNKPAETIELLGDWEDSVKHDNTSILSNAYLAIGNSGKAMEILQISAYLSMLSSISALSTLLHLSSGDDGKSQQIIHLLDGILELINLEDLHMNTCLLYYLAAAGNCASRGLPHEATDYLGKYANLCCRQEYPLTLHGSEIFDMIEHWFNTFDLGNSTPTEENTIRKNMLDGVLMDPYLASLAENEKYKSVVEQLRRNLNE
ncbi:MAG: helix-turn-helix transcriptional regulator [Clostridiales bacterium]|nr:helix-turn-helix transcriptional regulator [Clostridiales bacterium]